MPLKVKEYISQQARTDIAPTPVHDTLAQAMQQSDLTNSDNITEGLGEDQFVDIDGHGSPRDVPPLIHDPINVNAASAASRSIEVDSDAFAVMKNELATAHETNARLNAEVARLRSKCLQLENQASSGMYFFNILL